MYVSSGASVKVLVLDDVEVAVVAVAVVAEVEDTAVPVVTVLVVVDVNTTRWKPKMIENGDVVVIILTDDSPLHNCSLQVYSKQ